MYAPVSPGEASWGACGSPGSSRNVLRIKDRCHLPPSAPPGGSPAASSARPVASAATPCQGVVSRAVNGHPSLSCPLSPQASSSSSLPPTLSLLPCSHEAAPPPLTWQSLAWLPRAPHRPCWVPFRWADSGECPVPLPRSSRDTVFLFRRSHCEGDFRVLFPSPDSRSESRLPSGPVAWGSLPFTVTSSDFISPTSS